jgi:3-hydroxyacyl-CoA dehydrogenase
MEAGLERRGDVAVITMDNPPVAALSLGLCRAIDAALDEIENSPDVGAIVLAGTDGKFAVGAVVKGEEISASRAVAALADRIENSTRPVVAAIGGVALGAGLELALGAHLRVAGTHARLGFPDVTIGLLPGAGGTQRLPRLIGGTAALRMLLGGRAVSVETAQSLGLVDEIVDGDLVDAACDLARGLIGRDLPRTSARRDRLGAGAAFLEAVAEQKRMAERSALDAPARIVECVEAALLLPFDIGRGMEAAAFDDLATSDQAQALKYVSMSERRLKAAERISGRERSRPLGRIGIAGLTGGGAAMAVACLDAGFEIVAAERSEEALEAGVTRVIEGFDARVAAGRMEEASVDATLDRLHAVAGYKRLSECDLVISTSPRPAKRLIEEFDSVMRAGAILATAAEIAPPARIAATTSRPADVLGLHLYAGTGRARIVEIVPPPGVGVRAMATLRTLIRKLDLMAVIAGPTSTGMGWRLLDALHAAADLSLLQGASLTRIDTVLADWGFAGGSFARRDAEGLEARARRNEGLEGRLVAAGRGGRAAGAGFYSYPGNGRTGIEDEDLAAIVTRCRTEAGIETRAPSDVEIRKNCIAAVAGAGAQLLQEEAARRPADIDMIAIHGLGLARRTGGVMFAADLLGLEDVARRLDAMHALDPRIANGSGTLGRLAQAGRDFAALDA